MPLTAFSPVEGSGIFSWIISTGIFSHNNRRLAFNVSDDILINIRGYTIVFESRSEEEVTEKQSFLNKESRRSEI